jgi:RimJ/RimL family protein N-acetyltransferase
VKPFSVTRFGLEFGLLENLQKILIASSRFGWRALGVASRSHSMNISVREMKLEEVESVIDYFHNATSEHLELLGVDPTRLPAKAQWQQLYEYDYAQPRERRKSLLVLWQLAGRNLGFSSVDKIKYGEEAYMHLHVFDAQNRKAGYGAMCVRQSVAIYFRALALKRLLCEPNAFNAGPNRTLQKAGFRYVKTYMTVPGPLNFHQAVTQWVIER